MKLNNLPILDLHFFVKPNICIICDTERHTIIKAMIEEQINEDFCVDAKTFGIIKKLWINRKFNVDGNKLTIESSIGKYTCSNLGVTRPELKKIEEIGTNVLCDVRKLKQAAKYVSTKGERPIFNGVIINDKGEIFGTDTFRICYFASSNDIAKQSWSVPVEFINNLTSDQVVLTFGEKRVYTYIGTDYEIESSLYEGAIPDLKKITQFIPETTATLYPPENISLGSTKCVVIKCTGDEMKFTFADDTTFETIAQCESSSDFEIKVKTSYIVKELNEKSKFEIKDHLLRVNDNLLILCMK